MKHLEIQTPQPFSFDGHGINDAQGQRVCKVSSCQPYIYDTGKPERNREFDNLSNLFAASPVLYEALLTAEDELQEVHDLHVWEGGTENPDHGDSCHICDLLVAIRAALAAARGEQPAALDPDVSAVIRAAATEPSAADLDATVQGEHPLVPALDESKTRTAEPDDERERRTR